MTEDEWLACGDPRPMLEYLQRKVSDRKLRLFSVACCRRAWPLLNDERGRRAIEVGERCADGFLTVNEAYGIGQTLNVSHDYDLIQRLSQETGFYWEAISQAFLAAGLTTGWLDARQAASIAEDIVSAVGCQWVEDDFGGNDEAFENAVMSFKSMERMAQAVVLRDIFGNPFRPQTADLAWLTPGVVKLAQTIYEERPFDRLPELAKALEQVGCRDADLLAHCRRSGSHVRGCWVVDLMLGKS
jgi:hypothetical protein